MIELPNLTPSLPTVLLCRSGVRSQLATRQLLEAGFPLAQNLTGGILAYIHTFNLDWTTY
jgi:rhodanese-related sulfurtransferase